MNFLWHYSGGRINGVYAEFSLHGTYTLDDAQPMARRSATPFPAVFVQVYESSQHDKWPKLKKSGQFSKLQNAVKMPSKRCNEPNALCHNDLRRQK